MRMNDLPEYVAAYMALSFTFYNWIICYLHLNGYLLYILANTME